VTLGDESDEESFANTDTDAGLKGPVPRPSLKGDRLLLYTDGVIEATFATQIPSDPAAQNNGGYFVWKV
jgi:hypothetical protein